MAWTERLDKRGLTSKVWRDSDNPARQRFESRMGTLLHYASAGPDGTPDTEVNYTPQRVQNAALDGWLIQQGPWHYALGQPSDKATDGWVGFGGRQGQHWLKYRLARLGYLHWPTRAWQNIGGAPTYSRANLSQTTQTLTVGPEGAESTVNVAASATWSGLWTTPGGGDVSISWHAEGRRLKEEIVVNAAARTWVAANRKPTTKARETFFGLVFQLDLSDVPAWARKSGAALSLTDDNDDNDADGEAWAGKDALGRALFLLPIDSLTIPGTETSVRLRKRIWNDNGTYYLLVGIRCDALAALPAGDLVFDPTLTLDEGESGADMDTFILSSMTTANNGTSQDIWCGGSGATASTVTRSLIRFDLSSLDDTTITSADLSLRAIEGAAANLSIYRGLTQWYEGDADLDTPSGDGSTWALRNNNGSVAWAGGAGGAAGSDWQTTATDTQTASSNVFTLDVAADVQDYANGDATNYGWWLRVPAWEVTDWNVVRLYSSDHGADASNRPKIVVVYEEGGGGETYELAGTVAGASSLSAALARQSVLAGLMAGSSALSAALALTQGMAGTVAGASALAGGAMALTRSVGGTVAGASALSGALARTSVMAGTVAGASTLTGELTRLKALAGLIAGESGVSAQLVLLRSMTGTVAGASGLAGQLARTTALGGTVAGAAEIAAQSAISGQMGLLVSLKGTVAGASTLSGALLVPVSEIETVRLTDGRTLVEMLVQSGLLSATSAVLFTCPSQTRIQVTGLVFQNIHATNTDTVTVALHPVGGSSIVVAQETLEPGTRLEGRGSPLVLNPGDILRAYATTADEVAWTLTGSKEARV